MKISQAEQFVLNDFIVPEVPTAHLPGQAHVVCMSCYNKYDNPPNLHERVPPAPEGGNEYWYVWMLDHTAVPLLEWMARHLRRWHATEGTDK